MFLMGPFHCSKQHSILSGRSGLEAMLRRASGIIWTLECEGGYCYEHHLPCVLGAVLCDPTPISCRTPAPSQHHVGSVFLTLVERNAGKENSTTGRQEWSVPDQSSRAMDSGEECRRTHQGWRGLLEWQ